MGELRAIERLDEAKIGRIVDSLRPLLEEADARQWAIGDVLVQELPVMSRAQTVQLAHNVRWADGEARVKPYLDKIARELDCHPNTLERYRLTAAAWPPAERHLDQAWSKHNLLIRREDRQELILLPFSGVYARMGRVGPKRPSRRRENSFANISKAAAAAIEVLSDEDIAADKRVKLALTILVSFFEEAAGAA